MPFRIDNVLHQNIINVLNFFGITARCYFVGGAVRDNLLGLDVHDYDLTVECLTQNETDELVHHLNLTGNDFPVFRFRVQDSNQVEHEIELAAARIERSVGPRHTDFVVQFGENVTINEDLLRRDLTINSMAVPVNDLDQVIDLVGGINDLNDRLLRHTSSAFVEDPLRIFRLARFVAGKFSNFEVANETVNLCRQIADSTIHLSGDRVALETEKMFNTSNTPSVFFKFLKHVGNLHIWFPELYKMIGVPQPVKYHGDNDVFDHTMDVVDHARIFTNDPVILWAALFHDVGKILTPIPILPAHHNHEENGTDLVDSIVDRLRLSNVIRINMFDSIRNHMKIAKVLELKNSTLIDMVSKLNRNRTLHNVIAVTYADRMRNGGLSCDILKKLHVAEIVLQEQLPKEVVNRLKDKTGEQCKQLVRQFRINRFSEQFNL